METVINILRVICFLILVIALLLNIVDKRLKNPNVQIVVAIIIMFIFVFIDPLAGFFLACAIFVIYYKLFVPVKEAQIKKSEEYTGAGYPDDTTTFGSYITKEHLRQAQDNVVSDLNDEIVGFNDEFVNNTDAIYGVQGLSKDMPGYHQSFNGADLDELELK